jgi:hypothetical protein
MCRQTLLHSFAHLFAASRHLSSFALQTPAFAKLRETIFPKPRNHPEAGGFQSKGMTSAGAVAQG